MNKTTLSIIIVLLVVFIALLIPALQPDNITQQQPKETVPAQVCETLTSGCRTKVDDLYIEIKFPENIIYLNSFPVETTFSGEDASNISEVNVEFFMLKMNMGTNHYKLKKDSQSNLSWKGKAVLPICVTGRTDWQAHVSVKVNDKVYKTAFQFEVMPKTQ